MGWVSPPSVSGPAGSGLCAFYGPPDPTVQLLSELSWELWLPCSSHTISRISHQGSQPTTLLCFVACELKAWVRGKLALSGSISWDYCLIVIVLQMSLQTPCQICCGDWLTWFLFSLPSSLPFPPLLLPSSR